MIQNYTMVDVADNSGVKTAMCIRVKRGTSARGQFRRSTATVGDVIWVAIKKSLPTCQLDDKKVHKCVVIRTKSPVRRPDGSYVRFDSNAVVLLDDRNEPRGTRIFGAVARELREKNFMKIISLAEEVV